MMMKKIFDDIIGNRDEKNRRVRNDKRKKEKRRTGNM